MSEPEKLGIYNEVISEYMSRQDAIPLDEVDNILDSEGSLTGYLFRCGRCGKYHLWVDSNEDYTLLFGREMPAEGCAFLKSIDHSK